MTAMLQLEDILTLKFYMEKIYTPFLKQKNITLSASGLTPAHANCNILNKHKRARINCYKSSDGGNLVK